MSVRTKRFIILLGAGVVIVIAGIFFLLPFVKGEKGSEIKGMDSLSDQVAAVEKGDNGEGGKSIEGYEEALVKDPENLLALNNLGILYAERGKTEEALEHFERAIETEEESETELAKAHLNKGNVYLSQGEFDKAVEAYQEAGRIDESYIRPHVMLAAIYGFKGMKQEQIREYEKVIWLDQIRDNHVRRFNKFSPEEFEEWRRFVGIRDTFNDGFILEKKGKYEEAIAKYDEALKMEPSFVRAYFRRGVVRFLRREFGEARSDLERALEINPGMRPAKCFLGSLYSRNGELDNARRTYRELVDDFPHNVVFKHCLGAICLKEGNYETAEKWFREAREVNPEYTPAYNGLGDVYLKLGRIDEAEEQYEKAISIAPDKPNAYYNMACIYSRKGDNEEAFRLLLESIRRGFDDFEYIKRDPDLAGLRRDKLFQRLHI